MPKKNYHPDLALRYRGISVYHTLRDLAGGRENATYTQCWLSWDRQDRDADKSRGTQFDVRELPLRQTWMEDVRRPRVFRGIEYRSDILHDHQVLQLKDYIDAELLKPRERRAWTAAREMLR